MKNQCFEKNQVLEEGEGLAEVQWEESQIPPAALAEPCGWWFSLAVKVKTVVHKAAINPRAGPAGLCWVFRFF